MKQNTGIKGLRATTWPVLAGMRVVADITGAHSGAMGSSGVGLDPICDTSWCGKNAVRRVRFTNQGLPKDSKSLV
jgi:hypothetical protein